MVSYGFTKEVCTKKRQRRLMFQDLKGYKSGDKKKKEPSDLNEETNYIQ